ncbi:hypothetical protein CBS101457_003403 [Exobasidium rhododendri]|nr:hypothetical protein CBS101457_003403 [Exobasidium rhododendri]
MTSTIESLPQYPSRRWWRKVPFVRTASRPLLCGDGPAQVFPDATANWWKILTFSWLNTLIRTGYTRPLQEDEIYLLPEHRHAKVYAARLEQAWARRTEEAAEKNAQRGKEEERKPGLWRRAYWKVKRRDLVQEEAAWRRSLHSEASFALTINEVNFASFWIGGLFKLTADMSTITSPLIIRSLLEIIEGNNREANLGKGFGLAVGLWLLLTLAVVMNVHGYYRSYTTGIVLRGAIIHVVYSRALRLSERAKARDGLGLSKLVTLISADASRIDFCCGMFHSAWTSVIQILVCLGLMIYSLGVSALPGFALVLLVYPIQNFMVRQLFALRRKSMKWTDARVKTVIEAISAIRLIKAYSWEKPYLEKTKGHRTHEMNFLRKRLLLRSLNMAVSFTIPTLAAVLAFVTYELTGHSIQGGNSGIIFSSLTFFLLLRTPLQILPIALSAIADAKTAVNRLSIFMNAEEREAPPPIIQDQVNMIEMQDATFIHHDTWAQQEIVPLQDEKGPTTPLGSTLLQEQTCAVSGLVDLDWQVKRGTFVCIVGSVGSGKSSLVRSLLGDMHRVKGVCSLGAQMAYCPQTAWLLSASIRNNILFGLEYDKKKYEDVLRRCCLDMDLATFSERDETIVGEKGISLSGGQKQRISLARAVYADACLRVFDDCFSALDAHVAQEVFDNVIKSGKEDKVTQVLVTHSLQFLPYADEIVYMQDGAIAEQGSYRDLIENKGAFAKLIEQHKGSSSVDETDPGTLQDGDSSSTLLTAEKEQKDAEGDLAEAKGDLNQGTEDGPPDEEAIGGEESPGGKESTEGKGKDIMQKEERLVGSVTKSTYINYLAMGRPALTMPLFVLSILLFQGTSIGSPLWLQYWQQDKYPQLSQGIYMGVYAILGIGQSLTLFCMSATFAIFVFYNSRRLHSLALVRIMFAPLSFFDTTPQGRITHRFSRDVDAVDNLVGESIRLFLSTVLQTIGSVVLVSIILPYFLAIVALILVFYVYTGMFYRPASRELRRLNNLLRSPIYEHFNESLSGLPTLRAYGALDRFKEDNARRVDTENKAYWLSIACQRWLNIRLDFFGALLCLGVALLVVGLQDSIPASAGGVVLSYIVTMQTMFGQMIRQSAEIENNMNSIERLLHYATQIEQEEPHETIQDDSLPSDWPSRGEVEFRDVVASHRAELPPALKGTSMHILSGEKIGIVGRTGSGKSTLLSSLLRLMELSSGSIIIDGVDIRTVGLTRLRNSIAVIGQDAILFQGTLRYNLDPLEQYDDARLNDVLKQVGLSRIDGEDEKSQNTTPLTLDFEVAEEGSNLSQGQRALISIARALIKKAKIVLIDEATASVDRTTDAMIQRSFELALRDATVFTVAHRLHTVIGVSDRVCVMSDGVVSELGSPTTLYNMTTGLFRQLCDSASIDAAFIEREREQNSHL